MVFESITKIRLSEPRTIAFLIDKRVSRAVLRAHSSKDAFINARERRIKSYLGASILSGQGLGWHGIYE